ncbi:MAG: hypothetical protein EDX89_15310 [Acidobacteria bacterium]|nr:MAG: hypothetical protein EDX89_15310 [Acidobacteriota bacterium]MCE7956617.1 hypothetical protein [Acidobacteria bacterium ACB2]
MTSPEHPHPFSRPLDTSEAAWRKVREIHARLGPEGRVEAAFAASELAREAVLAGIRMRHPEYDDFRLRTELFRRIYGDALADRFTGAAGSSR